MIENKENVGGAKYSSVIERLTMWIRKELLLCNVADRHELSEGEAASERNHPASRF